MKISLGKVRLVSLALCFVVLSMASAAFVPRGHSSPGIFKITLMVPGNANPARQSWSLVVQNELQGLGIDAGRVLLDFNTIIDRVIQPTDPNIVGKTYDNGGWDTLFIGNALGIDPDPAILYNSTNFAPSGSNYNLWNNSQADHLGTLIDQTVDKPTRLNYVRQWQALAQNVTPSATILYTKEIVAFTPKLTNGQSVFQIYHFPYWAPIEQLSSTPVDASIVLDQTGGPPANLIPELSSSYYDTTVSGVIFGSLAQRNDTVFKTMLPQLASGTVQSPGWSVSADGKTWTVSLRSGVTWHDGQPFDANDVKFTFDSIFDSTLKPPVQSFYQSIIGNAGNVQVINPSTVKFTLPNPYAYFVENILGGTAILPKHILSAVPYANWRTDVFNTGKPVTPCSSACPGPIGIGPYKWDHYDSTTQTAYLVRNDNYLDFPVNGGPELRARGAFTVKNYAAKTLSGSDAAITDITTGAADVLDSQYHLETQQSFLLTWGSSKLAIYDAYGIQEMGFNMKHPILGTGVDTPLGKQDPSKAALAAQYVRQAISHAIPRQLIIGALLYGYGKPGITSAVTPPSDGFNTALIPDDFNLTESRVLLQKAGYFPTTPTPPSFWDAYGVYIAGSFVAAVVAVSALFVVRTRRRPGFASPIGGTTPPPSPTSSPPP